MSTYRADIQIGVSGLQQLRQLRNEVTAANREVELLRRSGDRGVRVNARTNTLETRQRALRGGQRAFDRAEIGSTAQLRAAQALARAESEVNAVYRQREQLLERVAKVQQRAQRDELARIARVERAAQRTQDARVDPRGFNTRRGRLERDLNRTEFGGRNELQLAAQYGQQLSIQNRLLSERAVLIERATKAQNLQYRQALGSGAVSRPAAVQADRDLIASVVISMHPLYRFMK